MRRGLNTKTPWTVGKSGKLKSRVKRIQYDMMFAKSLLHLHNTYIHTLEYISVFSDGKGKTNKNQKHLHNRAHIAQGYVEDENRNILANLCLYRRLYNVMISF